MGRDKATLEVGGRSLLERSMEAMRDCGLFDRVLVSVPWGGPSEAVHRIIDDSNGSGLAVVAVADRRDEQLGPLAGLEAVLGQLEGPGVFVTAVDHASLEISLVRKLLELSMEDSGLAWMPRWKRGVEPLFAVYRRELCERITARIERDELFARALATEPGVVCVDILASGDDAAGEGEADGAPVFFTERSPAEIFRNLNTPEDYRAFREGG